jgi:hypothetical protein
MFRSSQHKTGSKHQISSHFCRILVFKDAPKKVFTGLSEEIGKPRDYSDNLDENKFR